MGPYSSSSTGASPTPVGGSAEREWPLETSAPTCTKGFDLREPVAARRQLISSSSPTGAGGGAAAGARWPGSCSSRPALPGHASVSTSSRGRRARGGAYEAGQPRGGGRPDGVETWCPGAPPTPCGPTSARRSCTRTRRPEPTWLSAARPAVASSDSPRAGAGAARRRRARQPLPRRVAGPARAQAPNMRGRVAVEGAHHLPNLDGRSVRRGPAASAGCSNRRRRNLRHRRGNPRTPRRPRARRSPRSASPGRAGAQTPKERVIKVMSVEVNDTKPKNTANKGDSITFHDGLLNPAAGSHGEGRPRRLRPRHADLHRASQRPFDGLATLPGGTLILRGEVYSWREAWRSRSRAPASSRARAESSSVTRATRRRRTHGAEHVPARCFRRRSRSSAPNQAYEAAAGDGGELSAARGRTPGT